MSELPSVRAFQPGDIITFGDITELPDFEDYVAENMFPNMTPTQMNAWKGRAALRDLVRPPAFNGRIADIRLEVMVDPYAQLMNARERGWRFGGTNGNPKPRTNEFAFEAEELSEGFVFTADAKSSGKGSIGEIQSELWYVPVPKSPIVRAFVTAHGEVIRQSRGVDQEAGNNGGSIVQRYVAKSRFIKP